jgi:uncharacterized protein
VNGYLLDVNVLLALADPRHIHHDATHTWFAHAGRRAWATCPITENAFVRIASHAGYPNRQGEASAVLEQLRRMCATDGHHFWADSVSLRDATIPDATITHGQVTDIYLLALAVSKDARLATLDRHIPALVVVGGAAALEIIPA